MALAAFLGSPSCLPSAAVAKARVAPDRLLVGVQGRHAPEGAAEQAGAEGAGLDYQHANTVRSDLGGQRF